MSMDRLYYTDSYTTEFEAEVIGVASSDSGDRVRLAATYFYPTSGGQMHDLGRLGDCNVVDVVDEGGDIVHCLDTRANFTVGDRVPASIDSERRAHHRQQHTGQHILSSVLEEFHGLATKSSRLGERGNTLDVAGSKLTPDDLDDLERRCHALFWQALPVTVHLLDAEAAAARGLRKKVDRVGPVRVIEVEGVDTCACGGTHVRNTAEIGAIALTHLEKVSGGQRIHFHCGWRAEEARRQSARSLHALATELTTGTDHLVDAMRKLKGEVKDLQRSRTQLAQRLAQARAGSWFEQGERRSRGEAEFRWVHQHLDEELAPAAAAALKAVTREPEVLASFTLVQSGRGQLLVGRSSDVDVDCRELLSQVLQEFGGRGGGKADQARGGFQDADPQQIRDALARLFEPAMPRRD